MNVNIMSYRFKKLILSICILFIAIYLVLLSFSDIIATVKYNETLNLKLNQQKSQENEV